MTTRTRLLKSVAPRFGAQSQAARFPAVYLPQIPRLGVASSRSTSPRLNEQDAWTSLAFLQRCVSLLLSGKEPVRRTGQHPPHPSNILLENASRDKALRLIPSSSPLRTRAMRRSPLLVMPPFDSYIITSVDQLMNASKFDVMWSPPGRMPVATVGHLISRTRHFGGRQGRARADHTGKRRSTPT